MSKHEEGSNLSCRNYTIRPEDDGVSDQISGEFRQAHDTVEVASALDPRRPRPGGPSWERPENIKPDELKSLIDRADRALNATKFIR